MSDAMLKSIAESGRYMLKNDLTAPTSFVVTVPGVQRSIKINSNDMKEVITYTVFVPKNIVVLKNSDPNTKIVAKINP
jgi:hypothetical protein